MYFVECLNYSIINHSIDISMAVCYFSMRNRRLQTFLHKKITGFLITPLCYKITMNNLINKWT